MPHFPGWFVAICVMLPIANIINNAWKNNRRIYLRDSGFNVSEIALVLEVADITDIIKQFLTEYSKIG